jgi:hypothetical protein
MYIKIIMLITVVGLFVFSCYLNEPDDPPVRLINKTEQHLIYFVFNLPEGVMLTLIACISVEENKDRIMKPGETILLGEVEDLDPRKRTIVLLYNTRLSEQIDYTHKSSISKNIDIDPCGEGMAIAYRYVEFRAGELSSMGFKIIVGD